MHRNEDKLKNWLQLAAFAILVIFAAGVFVAWQDVRRQQEDLKVKLAATQQQVQAADAREEARKAQLQQQLAKLAQQQETIQSPQQALTALPDVLPLPKALVERPASTTNTDAAPPGAILPAEDLKPLYDYAVSCKTCQAQLAAAQADLRDEKAKTQAVGRERDDALRVARGGSALRRVARAAKWFVIGAAAGAAAAKFAR